ncbi:MAG: cell wall metabolism sensor histidine kinase WalK [Pyrinomonadaceae bacterium]|nr:cell wall metabolism sensor histidine kinase WalK [Pyrinomonadaceae bacterium]MCX7639817.1 cell wall metabolism sensor histidine kinase WalK [Pyrinomonadaceae bacterium]MDW8304400.1 ATP-binding protein [Acidobacteriota bacterium]
MKSPLEFSQELTKISQRLISKVLDTLREGAIVTNDDTQIIVANQVARNAFIRLNLPLEKMRISEVFRDITVHKAFRKALDEKIASEIDFEFITNEKRVYRVCVSPLEIEKLNLAIGIFYNVTEIERLERIRQEFLSNVSHELRTPLTSILAFVETLEEGAIDDAAHNRKFLSIIRKNVERMHRLIEDILELSSIEAGKIAIQPQKLNLSKIVEEVFVNLANKAKDKKISLKNSVKEEVFVFADAIRLEQMLTNLVDNAIKFNRENGLVEVFHQQDKDYDFIFVKDTGDGISAEHLPRIFERFYRTDKARSLQNASGTGLGLAIVKHLARLHSGEVGVSSSPGEGSTFWIKLPKEPISKN